MKKLLIFLIVVSLSGTLVAQNWYQYLSVFHGGVKVGNTVKKTGANKTGSYLLQIDSITTDNVTTPTKFKLYDNNTQLIPDVPSGGYEDAALIFLKLQSDTINKTANFTVSATEVNKEVHCWKATSIIITVPKNLSDWPVGTYITFAGFREKMVFKAAADVVFVSDKDSTATARKGQPVSIKKLAANKYWLLGTLTD
jgi:hypothetical protein